MNICMFIGNLTRDPESGSTTKGTKFCEFTIATKKRNPNATEPDYIKCVCYGSNAEVCSKYLVKGNKVAVTGSITLQQYESKKTGKNYANLLLEMDKVEFLTPKASAKQTTEEPAKAISEPQEFIPVDMTDELPF